MANSAYRASDYRLLAANSFVKPGVTFLALGMALSGCASAPRGGAAGAQGALPVSMQAGVGSQQCTATATGFEPPTADASASALGQNPDQPMRMIAASCWSDDDAPIPAPLPASPYRGTLVALNRPVSRQDLR